MPNGVLYIFCEGETEVVVFKSFLREYWSVRFVDCEVIGYSGAGDLKVNFAVDANRELSSEPDASVLCLLDLYEEPFEIYHKNRMSRQEGFEIVRKQLLGQIKPEHHHRFGAFPVVMELETWLLADPSIQSYINSEYPNPEEIDHPAQALKQWRSDYNKRIHGKILFNRVSARRVYDDNCPHFKLLVEWLINEPDEPDPKIVEQINEWEQHQSILIKQRDLALQYSEKALQHGILDEAIEWDEKAKRIDKEIQEYTATYFENFD